MEELMTCGNLFLSTA